MWLVPLLVLAWITKINSNNWQKGPCSLHGWERAPTLVALWPSSSFPPHSLRARKKEAWNQVDLRHGGVVDSMARMLKEEGRGDEAPPRPHLELQGEASPSTDGGKLARRSLMHGASHRRQAWRGPPIGGDERTLMSPIGGWIGETTKLNFSSLKTWYVSVHWSDRWWWLVRPVARWASQEALVKPLPSTGMTGVAQSTCKNNFKLLLTSSTNQTWWVALVHDHRQGNDPYTHK
jgi:hypothetical protein